MRCENGHVFCSNCQRYEPGWIGSGRLMCPKCDTESYDHIGDIGEETSYSDYSSSDSSSESKENSWIDALAPIWMPTVGGVILTPLGWILMSAAATWSFAWFVGLLMFLGGCLCLIPAAMILGVVTIVIFIVCIVLAILLAIIGYFVEHPY